jgi:hypothetical protein
VSRLARLAAALAVAPGAARACAVCFSADAESAALGRAFNLAILLMLGVTFALMAAGTAWFWRIERRRRALDRRYFELIRDDPASR